MDLNQALPQLNIRFTLRDIKFTIQTKRSSRLTLIGRFGKAGYECIVSTDEPLLLGEIGSNYIGILSTLLPQTTPSV